MALAVVAACRSRPSTDRELAKRFQAHRAAFDKLATAYSAGDFTCSDDDTIVCRIIHHGDVLDTLHQGAGVRDNYVLRSAGRADGVWLPVETYGPMSTSSSGRGYVFLRQSPAESVANTLDVDSPGRHYAALAGGWYLFVVN